MGGADELFGQETPQVSGADSLFSEEQDGNEKQFNFVLGDSIDEKPDRAARSIDIMRRTGVSKKFIDENFDEFDREARKEEFNPRKFMQESPKVADWMVKNPDYAALLREDKDSLTALEKILTVESNARKFGEAKASRGPETSISSVLSGIGSTFTEGFVKAKIGAQIEYADVIGSDRMRTQALRDYEQSEGRELRDRPEIEDTLGRWVYGGAASTVRMVPAIAAAVITKNPKVGLAVIGGQMQPETYAKYRARGGTPAEALLGSSTETGVEIAMEMLPMGFIVDNLGKVGAGTFLKGFLGRELPTELAAEISQAAIDTAIANPDKTWQDFVDELPDTIGQTVTATLMMSGGLAVTNEALKRATAKEAPGVQAKLQEDFFKALGENATNSKLKERLPDSYKEIINELTKDGPVENVYAPIEFFQSHFQEQGIDPRQLATELGIERQYDEAVNTGGKISIPTSVYAKDIAATEHNAMFAKELSFAPDQMSSRETEEFLKEAEKEKEPETDEFRTSLEAVMTPIRDQLKAIYPADTAGRNAAVIEARLSTRSQRLGIDPQELMKRRPLSIVEGGEETGNILNQIAFHGSPYKFQRFDMSKIGTGEGAQAYGHGLYFSETPDVAKTYQGQTTVSPRLRMVLDNNSGDIDKSIESLNQAIAGNHNGGAEVWGTILDEAQNYNRGAFYKVDISDDAIKNFLDWDKPLSEQPHLVDIVRKHIPGYMTAGMPNKQIGGSDAYLALAEKVGDDKASGLFKEAGIPGIRYLDQGSRGKGEGTSNYVVFDDSIIKILDVNGEPVPASEQKKIVDAMNKEGELFQSDVKKPTWFSAVTKGIESAKQTKATSADWKAIVSKMEGVKKDEIEAVGLSEWLDLQKGPVTKEQVLEFVRANGVQVKEVVKGDRFTAGDLRDGMQINSVLHLSKYGDKWAVVYSASDNIDFSGTAEEVAEYINNEVKTASSVQREKQGLTKFSSYQLPGGENYRELLLTLPETEADKLKYINADNAFRAYQEELRHKYGSDETILRKATPEEARRLDDLGKPIRDIKSKQNNGFKSSHFDEPNILAHVRFNERTDADGKRVLFIEEVQSDWAQKGRKDRFAKPVTPERRTEIDARLTEIQRDKKPSAKNSGEYEALDVEERMLQEEKAGIGVPSAPFVTKTESWSMLAMKRMIRYAAENGFDRVAWTTGEQQAARYDLSKQLQKVTVIKKGDLFNIKGIDLNGSGHDFGTHAADKLEAVVGKELAAKIVEQKTPNEVYAGNDLKVGGEGMKAFYDQMLPQMVNKYVKKWGGKVGETTLPKFADSKSPDSMSDSELLGALNEPVKGYGVHSIDITPAMRDAVMQGQPLFQGKDIKRGSISVSPTGDIIRLFKAKNLSTLLHELSHRWLFEMQDDASMPEAPQQIKDDLAATLKYLGLESVEQADITRFEKGTKEHTRAVAANEKFAQTGEAYFMEGKAPSTALRRVFATLKAWMVAIYKALKQGRLDAEMTPAMRGVFDRLLATDEEIEAATAQANAIPAFTTAVDAGMTDIEFAAYSKTVEDSNREAREELDAKVMKQYKKTLTDIWKEDKAKVQVEVEAELDKDPIYSAIAKMEANGIKLDSAALKNLSGIAQNLPRNLTAKTGGIDPDMAAELLGFTSGEALVRGIAMLAPRGTTVSREVNIRMDQKFGNMLTDGTIMEDAKKAVMSDSRAKIIEAEIKALNKKAREVKPFLKGKDKAEAEASRAGRDIYRGMVPKLADVRERAQSVIAGKLVREIKPHQYFSTARQASRSAIDAMRKKDYLLAAYHKGRELLNLELYREANNTVEQLEKDREYLKKFEKESTRKKMRGESIIQIDDILERFDLRRRSLTAIDAEKESLVSFIEKEAERLSAVVPDIAPSILNERYRKNYKDMTVEEFGGVVAAIKQLEALARREHKQYMEIRQMNFEQERTSILERMQKFNPKHFDDEGNVIPIKPDFVPDASKAAKKIGDKFAGEFLNSETILNILEGGSFGQVEQSLFGRMSERSNWKATRLEGLYKKLKPLFDQYNLLDKQSFARKDIGIGMTRENAVVVALLNGNKEGRERLNNYGFDEAKIQRIIGHLDQRDFNLVNGIWDVFDQDLWPELKALNERTRGQAPPKVEAVPYQTRFGEQKGGYFTLKYDTELDERAHSFDETKAVKDLLGGSMGMSAKTAQGSSTKRLEGVKLRPRLDLNVFSEAVNETVHDLAYREAVADSMKLLNDPDIRDSIKAIAGTPAYRALVTRVRETAAPPRNPSGFIEKALTIARKNTIVTMLSGVRTALLNITGAVSIYSRSFEKASPVSAGLITRELGKFYSWRMNEMFEFATTHSEYMRHRFNNFDRDLQDMANKLTVKGKLLPDTSQFLWLMGMTDRGVTVPVWNASFAEGMKRFKNDTKQAVEYADHIVRQTQGSGRDVDLAKIMSGHGGWGQLKKVFTMFQSFFNGQLGQLVRAGAISAREAQENRAEAVAKFTARFILIVSIPAAIATIGGRDDDDMDEDWFKKFAYINVMYIAAMFPLVRDMASYAWSKFDKSVANYGLKLSPVQSAGEGLVAGTVAVKDIIKGEGTKKDVKDLIMGTSYAVGLPGKLISDVVLGTNAYLEGDKGPSAILFGPGSLRE